MNDKADSRSRILSCVADIMTLAVVIASFALFARFFPRHAQGDSLRWGGLTLAVVLALHMAREFFTRKGAWAKGRLVFVAAFLIVAGWAILSPDLRTNPRTGWRSWVPDASRIAMPDFSKLRLPKLPWPFGSPSGKAAAQKAREETPAKERVPDQPESPVAATDSSPPPQTTPVTPTLPEPTFGPLPPPRPRRPNRHAARANRPRPPADDGFEIPVFVEARRRSPDHPLGLPEDSPMTRSEMRRLRQLPEPQVGPR